MTLVVIWAVLSLTALLVLWVVVGAQLLVTQAPRARRLYRSFRPFDRRSRTGHHVPPPGVPDRRSGHVAA